MVRLSVGFASLASVILLSAPVGASVLVSTIDGGYNIDTYDTPELKISNSTAFDFTNAQMVLTGYQPGSASYGLTQTVSLGTISAASIDKVIWGTGGPLFSYDYDDQFGNGQAGNPACVQPYPFCALVGNFKVTFTASWANPAYNNGAGTEVSSVFTPADNASGGFVGWQGLDPNGLSETTYDDHVGTPNGVLANIYVGPPVGGVPEPTVWAMMLLGFGAVGAAVRSRQSSSYATA